MMKHNQDGAVTVLLVSFIVTLLVLIGALAFGAWAFQGRQDYKNHVDQKIAAAVAVAKQQEDTLKDQQFAEASKSPLRPYQGPEQFGSIVVQYPKTWSSYADDTGSGGAALDVYFAPGTVPALTGQSSVFALRLQVMDQNYADVLTQINSQQQANPAKISPYSLPQVPKAVGIRLDGSLPNQKTGSMIVLPLRDKTLEVWTEGSQYQKDFATYILPNLTFSP